jgi:hypothetical protein
MIKKFDSVPLEKDKLVNCGIKVPHVDRQRKQICSANSRYIKSCLLYTHSTTAQLLCYAVCIVSEQPQMLHCCYCTHSPKGTIAVFLLPYGEES